jgi:WD40 repeat protein
MKYELNHDVIAKQVFEKASADMKSRRKIELMVKTAYEFYLKRNALLTVEQLEEIRPARTTLNLKAEELKFIELSEQSIVKAQRRKFWLTAGVIAALTATLTFALWQWRKAVVRQTEAEAGRLALLAQQQLSRFNFNDALHLAGESLKLEANNLVAQDILSQVFHRGLYNQLTPLSTGMFKEDSLADVVLSNSGALAAIVLQDSTIKVYDITQNPNLIGKFKANTTFITPVFSPDDSTLLTIVQDSLLQINRIDGREVAILRGHTDYVVGATYFNKDTIISWGGDGYIKMWDAKGSFLKDIGHHESFVRGVEISSDSVHILSFDDGDVVKNIRPELTIWSLKDTKNSFSLTHLDYIHAGKFWNSDSVLVFGAAGIEMWSRRQKRQVVRPLPLEKGVEDVHGVVFSSDADKVFYYSTMGDEDAGGSNFDYLINIHDYFDLFGGKSKEKARLMKQYQQMSNMKSFEPKDFLNSMKKTSNVSVSQVDFFDNEHFYTSIVGSNEVIIRDMVGKPIAILAHPTEVFDIALSKNKNVMTTASFDGWIKIWKQNNLPLITLKNIGHDEESALLAQVIMAPNDKYIVTLANASPMTVYDTKGNLIKHDTSLLVDIAKFSPTGSSMATILTDNRILLWDSTLMVSKSLNFEGRPDAFNYSSDGKYLMAYGNNKVHIYSEKGDLVQNKVQTKDEVFMALFIPKSDHYITVSRDSFVSEWDINGNLVKRLIEHQWVTSFDFSPDGKTFIVGDVDGNTTIHDYATLKKIMAINAPDKFIQSVQFFPDSKRILATTEKNTTAVYNVKGNIQNKQLFGGKNSRMIEFVNKGQDVLSIFTEDIELWNGSFSKITTLKHIDNSVTKPTYSVAVSKDGTRCLVAFDNGTAEEYYTPEGILECLKKHPNLMFHKEDKKRYNIVE